MDSSEIKPGPKQWYNYPYIYICIHIHIQMHTYTYTIQIHMYIYTHRHMYIYTYKHTYTQARMYTFTHTRTHIPWSMAWNSQNGPPVAYGKSSHDPLSIWFSKPTVPMILSFLIASQWLECFSLCSFTVSESWTCTMKVAINNRLKTQNSASFNAHQRGHYVLWP